MSEEEWRPVAGFPGYYVSNHGRVRTERRRRRVLVQVPSKGGYLRVGVRDASGKKCMVQVHRLVVQAFLNPPSGDWVTRHLNGNPADNHVTNLLPGTSSENSFDVVRHGHHYHANKTHCPAGHPYDDENTYVTRYAYSRKCRACRQAANARYEARNPGRNRAASRA